MFSVIAAFNRRVGTRLLRWWRLRRLGRYVKSDAPKARSLLENALRDDFEKLGGSAGGVRDAFLQLLSDPPVAAACSAPGQDFEDLQDDLERFARSARRARRSLEEIAAEVDAAIGQAWPNAITDDKIWPLSQSRRLQELTDFSAAIQNHVTPEVFGKLHLNPAALPKDLLWLDDAFALGSRASVVNTWNDYVRVAWVRKSVQHFLKKFNWGTYIGEQWKTVIAWGIAFVFLGTIVYRFSFLAVVGYGISNVVAALSLLSIPDQKDSVLNGILGVLIFGSAAFWAFKAIWRREFLRAVLAPERFNSARLPESGDAPPLALQVRVFEFGLAVVAAAAVLRASWLLGAHAWLADLGWPDSMAAKPSAHYFSGDGQEASCIAGIPIAFLGERRVYLTWPNAVGNLTLVDDKGLDRIAASSECEPAAVDPVLPPNHGKTTLTFLPSISPTPPVLKRVALDIPARPAGSGRVDWLEEIRRQLSFLHSDVIGLLIRAEENNSRLGQQQGCLAASVELARHADARVAASGQLQECLATTRKDYTWTERTGLAPQPPKCEEPLQRLKDALHQEELDLARCKLLSSTQNEPVIPWALGLKY